VAWTGKEIPIHRTCSSSSNHSHRPHSLSLQLCLWNLQTKKKHGGNLGQTLKLGDTRVLLIGLLVRSFIAPQGLVQDMPTERQNIICVYCCTHKTMITKITKITKTYALYNDSSSTPCWCRDCLYGVQCFTLMITDLRFIAGPVCRCTLYSANRSRLLLRLLVSAVCPRR